MDRRNAIKRTSLIMGAALSTGTLAGLMAGCKAEKQLDWHPIFLTEKEVRTVSALTDTLLPKTDTPSASDVGVPQYIDDIIGNFWSENDQNSFKAELANVNQIAIDKFGTAYDGIKEDEQNEIMDHLVENATKPIDESRPFFRQLKELTYSGYFSSEIIGEEVLAYNPVPGEYIGDLPMSEVDNAWSL